MMVHFTEYSLPISPQTLYFGFAFDGVNYYFSTADKQILILDNTYVQVNLCPARRFYYSLCYDPCEKCFWGAAYGCPGVLFQLSPSFEEVKRVLLRSMTGGIDVIGGLSYDCYNNRLLFVCKNRFYTCDCQGNAQILADRRIFGENILGVCALPEGLVYLTKQQCCSQLIFVSHNCGKVLERYIFSAEYQIQALLMSPDCRGRGGYSLQVYSLKHNHCPCLLTFSKEPANCEQCGCDCGSCQCGSDCASGRPNPGSCQCSSDCASGRPNPCQCTPDCASGRPNPCQCTPDCSSGRPHPGPCQSGSDSTQNIPNLDQDGSNFNLINLLMGGLLSGFAQTQGQQTPSSDCNGHTSFPNQGQSNPCPPSDCPPGVPCQEHFIPGCGCGMPPLGQGQPNGQCCYPGCPCMNPCGSGDSCMNPCGCIVVCDPGCGGSSWDCCPPQKNCCDAYAQALESIALSEAALAHILNAEGEKLQKVIAADYEFSHLIQVNASVQKTITDATYLEQVLTNKLEALLKNPPCGQCGGTCPCPPPCPCPCPPPCPSPCPCCHGEGEPPICESCVNTCEEDSVLGDAAEPDIQN